MCPTERNTHTALFKTFKSKYIGDTEEDATLVRYIGYIYKKKLLPPYVSAKMILDPFSIHDWKNMNESQKKSVLDTVDKNLFQ